VFSGPSFLSCNHPFLFREGSFVSPLLTVIYEKNYFFRGERGKRREVFFREEMGVIAVITRIAFGSERV